MTRLHPLALLLAFALTALVAPSTWAAPGPQLTQLLSKDMADLPGKELLAITVTYPPGGSDPAHRHDAHVFVYVLEGAIVMKLQGGKEVMLQKGQTFYEAPGDVHTVSRNASRSHPAKFLVVFVKNRQTDPVLPLQGEKP